LIVRAHVHGTFGPRAWLVDRPGGGPAGFVGAAALLLPPEFDPGALALPLSDPTACASLAHWFDGLWTEASDLSGLIADELRRSWVAALATPYDVYMKALYTLVRDRVEFGGELFEGGDVFDRLADFQKSAVRQVVRMIRQYGGALVADVVGLGKSFIGAAVVQHFERAEHARPLVVCPAPLVDMWRRYNESLRLNAQVVSTGQLRGDMGDGNPLLGDYLTRDRDFVLIDESHAFRHPGTQRYRLLAEFLAHGRRRACLLTATPQNRSPWDVYHQIKLFHPEDRTSLPVDPPDLREYFRAAERGERQLPALLSNLLVRRTRQHVLRFYGHDGETGQRVDPGRFDPYRRGERRAYVVVGSRRQFFPRRELETIEYSIEDTYQGLYDDIRRTLVRPLRGAPPGDRLLFARYRLYDYVLSDRRGGEQYTQLRTAGAGLHGLMRVLLFKRLESSVEAFRSSVRRMASVHRSYLTALGSGIVPAGEEAQELLAEAESEESTDWLDELRQRASRYHADDFDTERLALDLTHDLRLLERLLTLVEPITSERDAKLQVLLNRLGRPPLALGKRLIFTQFADTARYLYEHLRSLGGPGAAVELLLSNVRDKGAVVGRFAPRANPEQRDPDPAREIGTLVTTDVLSEGLNLQDCAALVNYDLHWNPVRLIQRFGRIDRVGSEHEQVFAFNFLPEAGLERHLGLRRVLRERIREIHETIGEDASILEAGERLNEEAMYAVYEARGEALDELEDDEDRHAVQLAEAEELLRRLREEDPAEYARIAALPDGLRSAKRAGAEGVFVFCQAGNYREVRLLASDGAVVSDDLPRLLALLRCGPETPAADFPSRLAPLVPDAQRRFAEAARRRQAELAHAHHLTPGQRYVLRELRAAFSGATDLAAREQADLLDTAFRGSLTQALGRELNRLRRHGVTGPALVRALSALYYTHGLRDRPRAPAESAAPPRLVCCEAFVRSNYQEDRPT
jgi:superfamily II DNA or RNA helicase